MSVKCESLLSFLLMLGIDTFDISLFKVRYLENRSGDRIGCLLSQPVMCPQLGQRTSLFKREWVPREPRPGCCSTKPQIEITGEPYCFHTKIIYKPITHIHERVRIIARKQARVIYQVKCVVHCPGLDSGQTLMRP